MIQLQGAEPLPPSLIGRWTCALTPARGGALLLAALAAGCGGATGLEGDGGVATDGDADGGGDAECDGACSDSGGDADGDVEPDSDPGSGLEGAGQESWLRLWVPSHDINAVARARNGDVLAAGELDGQIWVSRVTAEGGVVWQRRYGAARLGWGQAVAILEREDESLLVLGSTRPPGTSVQHAWLAELEPDGELRSQRRYAPRGEGSAGRALTAGEGGVLYAHLGDAVVKLSPELEILWQRSLRAPGLPTPMAFFAVEPAGVVAGAASEILRVDGDGEVAWSGSLEGSCSVYVRAGAALGSDIVLAGGIGDLWIVRLDGSGSPLWAGAMGMPDASGPPGDPCFHGCYMETALDVAIDEDGSIVTGGVVSKFAQNATGGLLWLAWLDASGAGLLREAAFGFGAGYQGWPAAHAVVADEEGCVAGGHSEGEALLLSVGRDGRIEGDCFWDYDVANEMRPCELAFVPRELDFEPVSLLVEEPAELVAEPVDAATGIVCP